MTTASEQAMLEVFGEVLLAGDKPSKAEIRETFSKVAAMIRREDVGWRLFMGSNDDIDRQYGLKLQQLKDWGKKVDEAIIGSPWIGAGFRRRADYILQNGIRHGNVPQTRQGSKGLQEVIDRPGNQFHFFGDAARREREQNMYSKGIAFWIGNEETKDLEAIPLHQITDELRHPGGLGFAWAYLREWTEVDLTTGEGTPQKRWYFTDRFVDKRVSEIKKKGEEKPVEVDQKHVIFDMHVNRAQGLVYGAPDALAAMVWNEVARDATLDGRAVQRALAMFAFKANTSSKEAGETTAIKVATADGAGNTFIGGKETEFAPLASAGKGYEFDSIRFLVSIVATSLDISVIDLTANPGDAGSSYGAGQLMSLPTRLAMETRRRDHIEIEKRVLDWIGVSKPEVVFVPFAAGEEIYRSIQALVMEYDKGTMTLQELRDRLDDLMGRPNGEAPGYDQHPQVLLAKAMKDAGVDKAATAPSDGGGASAPQTASPAQGRSTGAGDQGSAGNDIRRD